MKCYDYQKADDNEEHLDDEPVWNTEDDEELLVSPVHPLQKTQTQHCPHCCGCSGNGKAPCSHLHPTLSHSKATQIMLKLSISPPQHRQKHQDLL